MRVAKSLQVIPSQAELWRRLDRNNVVDGCCQRHLSTFLAAESAERIGLQETIAQALPRRIVAARRSILPPDLLRTVAADQLAFESPKLREGLSAHPVNMLKPRTYIQNVQASAFEFPSATIIS